MISRTLGACLRQPNGSDSGEARCSVIGAPGSESGLEKRQHRCRASGQLNPIPNPTARNAPRRKIDTDISTQT